MSPVSICPFLLMDNGHLVYECRSEIVGEFVKKYLPISLKFCELSSHTVTICAPNENLNLTEETVKKFLTENPSHNSEQSKLIDLGLGCDENYYILVHYPFGDKIRKYLKLKSIQFYLNLSQEQNRKPRAIQDSIVQCNSDNPAEFLIDNPSPIRTKQIEVLEWTLENYPKTAKLIIELSKSYPKSDPNSEKILKLSDMLLDLNDVAGFYMKIKILQAMDESALNIFRRISSALLKFKISIPDSESESAQQRTYIDFILKFLNEQTNEGQTKYYFYEVETVTRKFVRHHMLRNFGWVRANCTAGSSAPSLDDLKIFEKMGVKNVITCLEKPLELPKNHSLDLKIHFFEIQDRTPPTFEQMNQILEIISKGEPTVVHCLGGVGRTNTVLACDLIHAENLNSQQAISKINEIRPKVILDDCQVKFIREFSNQKYQNLEKIVKLPKIMMFAGYPASGKSTLSQHICEHLGEDKIIRINQDEMGRKKIVEMFNDNLKSTKTILVDGCNLTIEKRAEWQEMSFGLPTWVIFMDMPMEECKYRIVRRVNHPTVKNGLRMLDRLDNTLEPPELCEGFEKIVTIVRDTDIELLLKDLGIGQSLVVGSQNPDDLPSRMVTKFPRTRHLINLGSATRDDLLFSAGEQHEFSKYVLEVEEKVDGANLGILVRADYKIQVQNRSHFVSSTYHPQFKLLDKWILRHSDELVRILEPETEILYGEWLYMKHSIPYTNLPDYFLAFDLYNVKTKTFLSRDELVRRLEGTTIHQVPLIVKKQFSNTSEIVDLLKKKSSFYDGLIEGVYLRVSQGLVTMDRAKVVRQDFICGSGNENVRHWTKQQLTINTLAN